MLNDTWNPIFDKNARKLNEALHGAYIRMPGFIVPLEIGAEGVSEFVLVPYQGACIHTPPPPPNQLVLVQSITPWPSDDFWQAVWVEGRMGTQLVTTDIAQTGYALTAEHIDMNAIDSKLTMSNGRVFLSLARIWTNLSIFLH